MTLGLGHPLGATFWADFAYTLRTVGYDGTLNIEHEDTLVNSVEGVGRAAASCGRSSWSSSPTGSRRTSELWTRRDPCSSPHQLDHVLTTRGSLTRCGVAYRCIVHAEGREKQSCQADAELALPVQSQRE